MRFISTFAATPFFLRGLVLGALGLATAAHAQELPAGVTLGMTAAELQQALPAVAQVKRPQRLAGGLVGRWRTPAVQVLGLSGEQTFFFTGVHLSRVEFFGTAPDAAAAAETFNDVVAWGRGQYGPEVSATDASGSYAVWTVGDTEVYVQRTGTPPSLRLVYKIRQTPDAGAL